MGMILRIASSRIVGQGDIVGRSGYFSLNLSANSVMRGRLDARRTLKSLVADLRLTSPLIHADWEHLFANTFPLLFLLWCLLYFYRDLGIGILFFIWIVSGILTFIIGKPGWHIGASSIIYSLAFFLFFSGILRKHVPLVALSLLVTFLYGSLVWNMFPQFASSTTSWEGHLGGAAAGIAAAILFRHKGPQQPELFIDEEEEDNRSYPEDEEVITNPDQEKKE